MGHESFAMSAGVGIAAAVVAAITAVGVAWVDRRMRTGRRSHSQRPPKSPPLHANGGGVASRYPSAAAATGVESPRPWVIVPEDISGKARTTACAEPADTVSPHATFADLVVPIDITTVGGPKRVIDAARTEEITS